MDTQDPVFTEGGEWFFWDEIWCDRHGPYATERQARDAIAAYAAAL